MILVKACLGRFGLRGIYGLIGLLRIIVSWD